MILAVFASLLLAQPASTPPPEYGAETAGVQNGHQDHDATREDPGEADEAASEAAEESAERTEEASEAAEEADEVQVEENPDMVCRRRHVYDDYGRRRSRKVCRPR